MYPIKTNKKYIPWNIEALQWTYTTVYLWSYLYSDFSEWSWSHPWVDMVSMVWYDEVFSCLDWEVVKAGFSKYNWNYVVIKHFWVDVFWDKQDIYSCYLHLDELFVSSWDNLLEWNKIWTVWNTWNSFWKHLHFQIDKNDALFHPYWPFSLDEATEKSLSFKDAVNSWLWIDKTKKHTINPLVLLDYLENKNSFIAKKTLKETLIEAEKEKEEKRRIRIENKKKKEKLLALIDDKSEKNDKNNSVKNQDNKTKKKKIDDSNSDYLAWWVMNFNDFYN